MQTNKLSANQGFLVNHKLFAGLAGSWTLLLLLFSVVSASLAFHLWQQQVGILAEVTSRKLVNLEPTDRLQIIDSAFTHSQALSGFAVDPSIKSAIFKQNNGQVTATYPVAVGFDKRFIEMEWQQKTKRFAAQHPNHEQSLFKWQGFTWFAMYPVHQLGETVGFLYLSGDLAKLIPVFQSLAVSFALLVTIGLWLIGNRIQREKRGLQRYLKSITDWLRNGSPEQADDVAEFQQFEQLTELSPAVRSTLKALQYYTREAKASEDRMRLNLHNQTSSLVLERDHFKSEFEKQLEKIKRLQSEQKLQETHFSQIDGLLQLLLMARRLNQETSESVIDYWYQHPIMSKANFKHAQQTLPPKNMSLQEFINPTIDMLLIKAKALGIDVFMQINRLRPFTASVSPLSQFYMTAIAINALDLIEHGKLLIRVKLAEGEKKLYIYFENARHSESFIEFIQQLLATEVMPLSFESTKCTGEDIVISVPLASVGQSAYPKQWPFKIAYLGNDPLFNATVISLCEMMGLEITSAETKDSDWFVCNTVNQQSTHFLIIDEQTIENAPALLESLKVPDKPALRTQVLLLQSEYSHWQPELAGINICSRERLPLSFMNFIEDFSATTPIEPTEANLSQKPDNNGPTEPPN